MVYNFAGHDEHYTGASVALVGILSLIAGSFWPQCAPASPTLRWLGVSAWFGVVLQGVLGGLRVVLYKDQIGIFHAALAQAFLVLVCVLALFTSRWWASLRERVAPVAGHAGFRRVVLTVTLLIFGQLILGATMRHQHAGLAIPDFPLAYHQLWPPMDAASVASYNEPPPASGGDQPDHRLSDPAANGPPPRGAADSGRGGRGAPGRPAPVRAATPLARLGLWWLAAILAQVALGAATIWSGKAADIATLHVMARRGVRWSSARS